MKVKLIISSYKGHEEVILPRLLNSLQSADFPAEDVKVYAGGYKKKNTKDLCGFSVQQVTHNSYDFTGLISLIEDDCVEDADWWLALHDTCEVGKNFSLLYDKHVSGRYDYIDLDTTHHMNLAYWTPSQIRHMQAMIMRLKNCDKKTAIMTERVMHRFAQNQTSLEEYTEERVKRDVYGDGILRKVCYFKTLDLHKYQATFDNESFKKALSRTGEWIPPSENTWR